MADPVRSERPFGECEGFTKLAPSVAIFVFYGLSLGMLDLALKEIDLGFAYAVGDRDGGREGKHLRLTRHR